jgi:hypothetical protein
VTHSGCLFALGGPGNGEKPLIWSQDWA